MKAPQQVLLKCPLCDTEFEFGLHRYEGRYLPQYKVTVCNSCYQINWDGWAPCHEPKLLAVLEAKNLASPPRNPKGLLPRE